MTNNKRKIANWPAPGNMEFYNPNDLLKEI